MLVAIEGATSAEPCLAADEKGEYSATEAVQCLRQEAVQGNDLAQYLLGSDYHAGCCDLPQNYAEALKWYRRAADQGNSGAQFVLGGMHGPAFFGTISCWGEGNKPAPNRAGFAAIGFRQTGSNSSLANKAHSPRCRPQRTSCGATPV
jgi:TPR repeat protein